MEKVRGVKGSGQSIAGQSTLCSSERCWNTCGLDKQSDLPLRCVLTQSLLMREMGAKLIEGFP